MKKISAILIFALFVVGVIALLGGVCAAVALAVSIAILPGYSFMTVWSIVCACYFAFIVFALTFWLLGTSVFNQIININRKRMTETIFKELYTRMNKG